MSNQTKNGKRYQERFKQEIVAHILSGQTSQEEISKQYKISSSSLYRWCIKYGVKIEYIDVPLGSMTTSKPPKEIPPLPDDVTLLKQRIIEMSVELRSLELRAVSAETMIDIAEKELGLEIRKKFATPASVKSDK
jgi:transposase-like protein